MAEIIRPRFGDGGGGPEDPMLETRVTRLEQDVQEMKSSLRSIELAVAEMKHLPKAADLAALRSDFAGLKADVAEMRGRLSQMPTLLQLVTVVITTWSAGAAMVFTLLRLARP